MGMRGPKRANKVGRVYGDYKVILECEANNLKVNRHYYLICECIKCGDIRKIRDDKLAPNMACKKCLWDKI